MDRTTPIQQGPPPTSSPGNNCLLTMALAGAVAHDCHVGVVQRHGSRLIRTFVAASMAATISFRNQPRRSRRYSRRISLVPHAAIRVPICFPMDDYQDVITRGIFYYAHCLCAVDKSDLLTAIGLQAPGVAIEFGLQSLCANHQIAILIKKRCTAGLEADQVIAVRLHHYDTIFDFTHSRGFSFPLFAHPTIGFYRNGDFILSHASMDVARHIESKDLHQCIRVWLNTATTVNK